jgi:drug/metabolite transporter (DMT)-like permease
MRNHPVSSVLVGVLIAAAVAGLLGVALANYVSNSVNPQDPNLTVEAWRAAYVRSVGWSALATAVCAALWLLIAHGGRGLDTKTGQWYTLWCAAMFVSALLAWLVPPAVREGPLEPMLINAALAFVGYWAATIFMTPDHYRFTPFLARVLWGRAAA